MKKLLSLFALAALLVGCSNNEVIEAEKAETVENNLPETEVFVQGQILSSSETRATTRGNYKWPDVNEAEGWESARFSIRSDNDKNVGVHDMPSAQYFGRSPGKVGNNKGKVFSLFPYGRYNDRDLDYYQKDKKTGMNIGLFRYVYDENGLLTQPAIKEAPLVEEILGDEKVDLEAAIAKGQNVEKNTKDLAKVDSLLNLGTEHLESHILWYVVKEVGMRWGWHVNGIVTDYEIPRYEFNPNLVRNHVEVDIHQQVHQDWNEIKTSLHIRADVESITINIPLNEEDVIEKDDFNVRVFNFDYSEYHITHTITHNDKGITIEISNIPAQLIQDLKDNFGDGLTIEIHSYCTTNDIWEQLKKSSVVSTGKPCTVNGQIHSALHPDPDDPTKEELVPITLYNP